MSDGWYGIDLDGTLAHYPDPDYPFPLIGRPVWPMVERVRRMLDEGKDVRVFTARVAGTGKTSAYGVDNAAWCHEQRQMIASWTERYLGIPLQSTAVKDFACRQIYDDRAVQVVANTGQLISRG